MNWINNETYIEIYPPLEFNYRECLIFLNRSSQEVLHRIKDGYLYKLLKVNGQNILCKIGYQANSIKVEFPVHTPSESTQEKIVQYICEWFDLKRNLNSFYEMAQEDKILQPLVKKYYGLRIIGMPDLFEALVWAIIGQQINLTFAYTLKRRFVEQFGESLTFEGETYWLFPTYERVAAIQVDDLRNLQFTLRKSEFIIDIAKIMASGQLTKEILLQQEDFLKSKNFLMAIRGVGAWTADYVLMKCIQDPTSFPIADVGLHNALKNQLALNRKPTIEEIKSIATHWEGWQAYATFYLWRSLYDETI
ncbi:DNA-3-methyladenine glycosylase 2 family protein [Lysinibacillus agricola]|uniref:DNA-3-methyladenine glycosylase II n=1 Tax=Lysinibacillus agricola TaxID=2590012 RepID=A0ABX7AVU2_9BACI|nr:MULTISPECIES: DNA-3-methyladenine glycosylase [Lysinibacillus]KOS63594.1 DNA-3-methyladenine glycosylase [Lysinibacillus sp. FJAT-14222]QQP14078.1 DNA-3-methyladenine glycosylase 2 family protein [Lysinibacillus agricola]